MPSLSEKKDAYLRMRNAILAEKPELAEEAARLAVGPDVIQRLSAKDVWERLWPLPFYSAQRVQVATDRINGAKATGCWETWTPLVGSVENPDHPWHVRRSQSGPVTCTASGAKALAFCEKSGDFADLPHRTRAQVIYRIAKLADQFDDWAETANAKGISFLEAMSGAKGRLSSYDIAFWHLHGELSDSLGPITACHAMADLGMACVKPDIWVSRISVWSGWVDGLTDKQIMANRHHGWRRLFNSLEEIALASVERAPSPNPLRELDFFVATYGMMRAPKSPLDLSR